MRLKRSGMKKKHSKYFQTKNEFSMLQILVVWRTHWRENGRRGTKTNIRHFALHCLHQTQILEKQNAKWPNTTKKKVKQPIITEIYHHPKYQKLSTNFKVGADRLGVKAGKTKVQENTQNNRKYRPQNDSVCNSGNIRKKWYLTLWPQKSLTWLELKQEGY